MNIFKAILNKIFPSDHPANADATGSAPSGGVPGTQAGTTAAPPAGAPTPGAANAPAVDVSAVLTEMQSHNTEKLNWKTSIVDLLKLLGLDSSMTARKQLASELNYTGSTEDSASMNMWLHKEVMKKLAANGGKLPDDMKD